MALPPTNVVPCEVHNVEDVEDAFFHKDRNEPPWDERISNVGSEIRPDLLPIFHFYKPSPLTPLSLLVENLHL